MHRHQLIGSGLMAAALVVVAVAAQPQGQRRAVVYEGARVIVGDGSAAIEGGALVVGNA